jgi:hypothetical protein
LQGAGVISGEEAAMKTFMLLIGVGVLAAEVAGVSASDRTAVYARVDKVVFEPNGVAPRAIQIWGVFSIARPNDVNDYQEPAKGYLYFELAGQREATLREWADFRQIAGTGGIVSFGNRFELRAKVRKASDPPEHADPYVVSIGLTKVRGLTDYAPVHALVTFRD